MESKGLSLRKTKKSKKPAISAPRQISAPINATGTPPRSNGGPSLTTGPPRRPSAVGGKTSDLVKRRYSTRFNALPEDFDPTVPPIPTLPTLPAQYGSSNDRRRGTSPGKGPGVMVDEYILQDANLQAEQYVTDLLTEASEQDIDKFHAALGDRKAVTSKNLQKSIYTSRAQFIKISKEAEKLKGEMRALRNLMSELKTNTTSLRLSSSQANGDGMQNGAPQPLSRKDRRSSVADRSVLRNVGLQSLWKQVEGAQQLVPMIPGRFVVLDAGFWSELDSATWAHKRGVRLFLLNDRLLVVHVRKLRGDTPEAGDQRFQANKYKADKAWPLLDIEIVDLAGSTEYSNSSTNVGNAILIRGFGQDTLTLRPERDDLLKTKLLTEYKKSKEEMRRNLRIEQDTTNKAKETINYLASRDPALLKRPELLESLSDITDVRFEVDGKQRDLRWIEEQVDRLDIAIALQNFGDAVEGVEALNTTIENLKSNTIAQNLIRFKAEARATKLADLITRELIDSHNNQGKTKVNVELLRRLDFEDRAREKYLEARSVTIHRKSRQCVFGGKLSEYIWEISFVYFTLIRNTVATYDKCFSTPLMSACVKWAKEQLDAFNHILSRQLSTVPKEGLEWKECLQQAKENANMLSEVGMDFSSFIGRTTVVEQRESRPVGLGLEG